MSNVVQEVLTEKKVEIEKTIERVKGYIENAKQQVIDGEKGLAKLREELDDIKRFL